MGKFRFQELLLSISTQLPYCSFSCLLHMLYVFICNAAGALLVLSMCTKHPLGRVMSLTGFCLTWLLIRLFNEAKFLLKNLVLGQICVALVTGLASTTPHINMHTIFCKVSQFTLERPCALGFNPTS